MGRPVSALLQPRYIVVSAIVVILIFIVFSSSEREKENVGEACDITHRVFLDVDMDKQRIESLLVYTVSFYKRQQKISGFCAQARKGSLLMAMSFTTREHHFIVLYLDLCYKEGI